MNLYVKELDDFTVSFQDITIDYAYEYKSTVLLTIRQLGLFINLSFTLHMNFPDVCKRNMHF
jgi:hypothetical protein